MDLRLFALPPEILLQITDSVDVRSMQQLACVSRTANVLGSCVLRQRFISIEQLITRDLCTKVTSPNASCAMTPSGAERAERPLDLDLVDAKLTAHARETAAGTAAVQTRPVAPDGSDHTILQFKGQERVLDLRVHEDEATFNVNVACQLEGREIAKSHWRAAAIPTGATSHVKIPMENAKNGFFAFSITNEGEEPAQYGGYDYDAVFHYKLALEQVFIDRKLKLELAEQMG